MALLLNMHRFRTIAIVGIVASHALYSFDWRSDGSDLTFELIEGLVHESSIWFMFIAGYLFKYLAERRFSYPEFLRGKARNLWMPYLVLSVPAIAANYLFGHRSPVDGFEQMALPTQVGLYLLTGRHQAAYWFIPAVTLIFLAAPLWLWIDRRPLRYGLVVPPLLILSMLGGRDWLQATLALGPYGGQVSKAFYLLPVFLLGMACSSARQTLDPLLQQQRRALALLLAGLLLGTWLNHGVWEHSMLFAAKIVSALLLVHALAQPGARWLDRFEAVGRLSFGIFFVHGFLINGTKVVMTQLTGRATMPASVPGFIAYIALVIVVCMLVLREARRRFGQHSRKLVGC